jgi:hypothetical protein
MTEVELGKILVNYLKTKDCEVWQEVVIGHASCDLVFKKDGLLNCVELKLALNTEVIAQAIRWKNTCKTWVAVPKIKKTKAFKTKLKIIRELGIGLILIDVKKQSIDFISYNRPPKLKINLYKYLSNEHSDDVLAGSKNGKRSTQFSRTIEKLIKYKEENKDTSLKDCIKSIEHHYKSDGSALGSIKKYIKLKMFNLHLYFDLK